MANRKPSHRAAERKAAKDRGEFHYFTGRPCKRGHIAERLTKSGYCLECRRERGRSEYLKNPEYFALKSKNYYDKNAEVMKQKTRRWTSIPENKEKMKVTRAAYMKKCGETVLEKARRSAKSYRERFPEKAKQAINDWWAKNPERKKTYHRNRRAKIRGNGGSHTQADINSIFRAQKRQVRLLQN